MHEKRTNMIPRGELKIVLQQCIPREIATHLLLLHDALEVVALGIVELREIHV